MQIALRELKDILWLKDGLYQKLLKEEVAEISLRGHVQ